MTDSRHERVRSAMPLAGSTWPLTPLDRFALQWLIQGTWVFDERLDVHALKAGLARLLSSYPILSGHVVAGERVSWSPEGVPVMEATDPTLGVADFDARCVEARRFACRFSPGQIRRGAAPLLTVKLTQIRDGCVLAVCCSHACLDGNGFYSMVRNLSRAARGAAFPSPIFERRGADADPRPTVEVARTARQAGWRRITPLDVVRYALAQPRLLERTFVAHFSPTVLRRCKETLARGSGCERLSTHSALIAHIAYCLARLQGLAGGDSFSVSVAVDQRGRVSSLDEGFAGNAVVVVVSAPIPALCTREQIAARLEERLEPMLRRPSGALESLARLTAEVVAHRMPWTSLPCWGWPGPRRALFYTNSFAKFPVYDLDFGSAGRPLRPVRAIPHNLGDPILVWPAPPEAGGLEVYFSGALARAVKRLSREDPWWAQVRYFDV